MADFVTSIEVKVHASTDLAIEGKDEFTESLHGNLRTDFIWILQCFGKFYPLYFSVKRSRLYVFFRVSINFSSFVQKH